MRRNRCRRKKTGLYFAIFGLGMIIAMICPKNFIVAVLAAAVVILGCIVSK